MELAAVLPLHAAHHLRGVPSGGNSSAHGAAEQAELQHAAAQCTHPHFNMKSGLAHPHHQALAHLHHYQHDFARPSALERPPGPLRPVRALLARMSQIVRQPAAAAIAHRREMARSRRRQRQQQLQQQTALDWERRTEGGVNESLMFGHTTESDGELLATDAAAVLQGSDSDCTATSAALGSSISSSTLQPVVAVTAESQLASEEALVKKVQRTGDSGGVCWRQRLRHTLHAWVARPACAVAGAFRPKGIGHNDKTVSERLLNVVSCLPFLFAGRNVLRQCASVAARRFGHCFLLVAGVAAGYHGSHGVAFRRIMRLADYWCIAVASCALRHAMYVPHTPPLTPSAACVAAAGPVASAAAAANHAALPVYQQLLLACFSTANYVAVPFAPSFVSSLNFALVEVKCAWMMLRNPSELAVRWLTHAALGGVASSLFLQETRVAQAHGVVPGWHAAWHLLSSMAIYTTTPFLIHKEQQMMSGHHHQGGHQGLLLAGSNCTAVAI